MKECFLKFYKCYLLLCLLAQVSLLVAFVFAVFHFELPHDKLFLGVPVSLRIIQIGIWVFVISRLRKLSNFDPRLPIRNILGLLVFSFLIDMMNSAILLFSDNGDAIDWNQLSVALQKFYPFISSILEYYGKNEAIVSFVLKIINPIPFGMAIFMWPFLVGFFDRDRKSI